jgi:hypothetical protein
MALAIAGRILSEKIEKPGFPGFSFRVTGSDLAEIRQATGTAVGLYAGRMFEA